MTAAIIAMAPTSPAKRVTRARTAAKRTDNSNDAPTRKTEATKITKVTASRKTKPTKMTEDPTVKDVEQPKKASTRTTKAASLASAPRRRIKITPMDAPSAVDEPAPEPLKDSMPSRKATAKPKQTRSVSEKATKEGPEAERKVQGRITTSARKKSGDNEESAVKTEGRPKRAIAAQQKMTTQESKDKPAPATRQTRARTTSNAEPVEEPTTGTSNTKAGTRKKVTFQDLPEDDKENHLVPARKVAAKKVATPATGMRAKPIRKPAAAATKKSATTSQSRAPKPAPRPLTPKKVSQINRQSTPTSSDAEDELSGSKTPVRDLSLSPKRNPQLGARISPVKRLEFGQQPDRVSDSPMLFSPARRPASPNKENFAQSPLKKAPRRVEVPPIFPSTAQQTMNVTATFAPSSISQSVLLQSPKRALLDSNAFSQSAMKPKTSPMRKSFLQSPARRLFSPAKRKVPEVPNRHTNAAPPEEIAVSSHFRASVSPQRSIRVHRMSDEELAEEMKDAVDFDQSILSVRSPLKVAKQALSLAGPEKGAPMMQNDIVPTEPEDDDEGQSIDIVDTRETASDDVGTQTPVDAVFGKESSTDSWEHEPSYSEHDAEEESTIVVASKKPRVCGTQLSEVLFRSTRQAEEGEESEDELAADMTPAQAPRLFRSSLTGANNSSRLSTVAPSSLSRDVGFTPLAAQMSGWLAASPEKQNFKKQQSTAIFSPVAAQHIDGEVQVNRQSTPRQHKSPLGPSHISSTRSAGSRTSPAPWMGPSPEKTSFFEEQMTAQYADEGMEEAEPTEAQVISNNTMRTGDESILFDEREHIAPESHDDTVVIEQANRELTTDLINFTNTSDTAMVDFNKLAKEADQLAPPVSDLQQSSSDNSIYGDENAAPVNAEPAPAVESLVVAKQAEGYTGDDEIDSYAYHMLVDSITPPSLPQQEFEVEQDVINISGAPPAPGHETIEMVTPVRPNLSLPRFANTVVSKVPLRPEGNVSPVKVPKKRSRSLSAAGHNESTAKRTQLTPTGKFAARSISDVIVSPDRSIRSPAPSPAHTTPGQMSFAVEDFGDSTLDGIEIPADEMEFDVGPPTATATPPTAKSTKTTKNAFPTPSRTPLKSVGRGILHGAVVYVEVHTTEGADASGVYVDLLAQMGARCVREWRWDPRASMNGAEDSTNANKIGITHVVYKDGGKRTLEKAQDAKRQVWCVGVRWVLE